MKLINKTAFTAAAKPLSAALRGSGRYAPLPWSPPKTTFDGNKMRRRTLGGSFDSEQIPTFLGIGVASAGAFWLGYKMPEPFKTILMGGAVVGFGYGIWKLFSGTDTSSGERKPGQPRTISDLEAFKSISAKVMSPMMYSEFAWGGLSVSSIPIRIMLTNPSPYDVNLILRVNQQERAGAVWQSFNTKSYDKDVLVKAGESPIVDVSIDALDFGLELTERLVIEKLRSADDVPIKMTEVTFFA